MALSVASTSFVAPTGNVNSLTTPPALPRPSGLAVGDLYVTTAIFQNLSVDNEIISPGFTRLSAEITAGTRLMITQARYIATAADLADVATTPIASNSTTTRVVAVGAALRSGVAGKVPELSAASTFVAHASTSAINWPATTGALVLGMAYTNTSAGTAGPTFTAVGGGTIVDQRIATADASPTSSNTGLVVVRGGTGVTTSPTFANGGGYSLAFAEVNAPVPPEEPEEPDAGADPGPDSEAIATGNDVPILSWAAETGTAPMTPLSAGWYREKRVGATEAGPGQTQTSTGALDLAGSSFFYYPGVPECGSFSSTFVETTYKPGGQTAAARWLFNLEFVVGATHRVELRLRAPVNDPALGIILVNGKRLADQNVTATGITVGQNYRLFLDFPTDERRVIKIYGLNNKDGRFGGVAVDDGGWVIKPNRTITKRVAFITDSLGGGAGTPPGGARATETWLWDFARHIEADEVVHGSIGGTGYVKTIGGNGESTFQGRLAAIMATDPDVLVIQGGQNDSGLPPADVQTQVEQILAATATVPERVIISTTTSPSIHGAIEAGVEGEDVTFVNAQDRPFAIGDDGVHPTFAGHRTLAAAIAERYDNGNPEPETPEETGGWVIRPDLLPGVRSLRELRVVGNVNATSAGGGITMQGPPDVQINDYVLATVIFQTATGGSSFQAPNGWTLLSTRGTGANRAMVTFGRAIRNGTDLAAVSSFTMYASATVTRVAGVVMAVRDIDLDAPVISAGDWAVATTSSSGLTVPGAAGARVLTFAYSNTSAATAAPAHDATGGTKLGQVTSPDTEGALPATTTLSAHYGASGVTFSPNVANAGAYRIALRQRTPFIGHPVKVAIGGKYVNGQLDGVVIDHVLRDCTPEPWPVPVKTRTVSTLMAGTGSFYIAHRGSGDLWPEHTMKAYAESVAHGMDAIEVSVNVTSDGVLVCHHDTTTTRMTGVNHTINATPWATLSGLTTTSAFTVDGSQPRQPISLVEDVLDEFASTHVIFIEAKNVGAHTALLDLMDTYAGGTQRFVWKQWGPSNGGTQDARDRGYKLWGYGFPDDLVTLSTWGVKHDFIGVAHTCSDAQVQQYVAYGKPTIMWEIHTPEDRDRAKRLGVRGMMTSNIKAVLRARPA